MKELKINFNTNEFETVSLSIIPFKIPKQLIVDFVLSEGEEALKIWVYKCLRTIKNIFPAYSEKFGHSAFEEIGKTFASDTKELLVFAEIRRALMLNEEIKDVYNFSIENILDERKSILKFSLKTKYNTFGMEVEEIDL